MAARAAPVKSAAAPGGAGNALPQFLDSGETNWSPQGWVALFKRRDSGGRREGQEKAGSQAECRASARRETSRHRQSRPVRGPGDSWGDSRIYWIRAGWLHLQFEIDAIQELHGASPQRRRRAGVCMVRGPALQPRGRLTSHTPWRHLGRVNCGPLCENPSFQFQAACRGRARGHAGCWQLMGTGRSWRGTCHLSCQMRKPGRTATASLTPAQPAVARVAFTVQMLQRSTKYQRAAPNHAGMQACTLQPGIQVGMMCTAAVQRTSLGGKGDGGRRGTVQFWLAVRRHTRGDGILISMSKRMPGCRHQRPGALRLGRGWLDG